MEEETKRKIGETQVKRKREAREFGTPLEEKRCKGCEVLLPIEGNFLKHKRKLKGGDIVCIVDARCHPCRRARRAELREKNREHIRTRDRAKYKKDREKILKYKREEHRIKQALLGVPIRPAHKYRHEINDDKTPLVPAKPFVDWWLSLNGSRPTDDEMGEQLTRAIFRAIHGNNDSRPLETRKIRLGTVDKACVLVGMPHMIHTLYAHI